MQFAMNRCSCRRHLVKREIHHGNLTVVPATPTFVWCYTETESLTSSLCPETKLLKMCQAHRKFGTISRFRKRKATQLTN